MFDKKSLQAPDPIFEHFIHGMRQRCDGFEPTSEDDMRYVFLHSLECLAGTEPNWVRLGYRVYQNDRLKMDLVVRMPGTHYFACEFKAHIGSHQQPQREHAWLVLNDLSRLALVSRQWGTTATHCPSYFVYLHTPKMLEFFRRKTPHLGMVLDAAVGHDARFDVLSELEIKLGRGRKPIRARRKPPHELELHEGTAVCVARECVVEDETRRWQVAIFKILGDVYPDY